MPTCRERRNLKDVFIFVLTAWLFVTALLNGLLTSHLTTRTNDGGYGALPVISDWASQLGIKTEQQLQQDMHHKVATLSCAKYGGPSDDIAQEMVYWSDIPSDAKFVSPFKKAKGDEIRYLTFEPDIGGWNNLRIGMETVVALAHAMGRTLVLPPQHGIYLLDKQDGPKRQRAHFAFDDFFDFESLNMEHSGLEIITMEEFLNRTAMRGKLIDKNTGRVSFPPSNRTNWDGEGQSLLKYLKLWLRTVTHAPPWDPDVCIVAFPATSDPNDLSAMEISKKRIVEGDSTDTRRQDYTDNPIPVDAPAFDRMREMIDFREELCLYDEELQKAPVIHLECDLKRGTRLLIQFYAFLFFQDWKQDLWTKRFVRDHLRYRDEIQCAAARVVSAVRERARTNRRNPNPDGLFDSYHIRRGDFQFKLAVVDAGVIHENSKDELIEGATVYIATDERNLSFFQPLAEHYDICFLHDFARLLEGVNTNFYGMLDQLVASRGRVFFGPYFSTFTAFINRMRGYHAVRNKLEGYEEGNIQSYHYAPLNYKYRMREYNPVSNPIWAQEFPVAWRDIDKDVYNE